METPGIHNILRNCDSPSIFWLPQYFGCPVFTRLIHEKLWPQGPPPGFTGVLTYLQKQQGWGVGKSRKDWGGHSMLGVRLRLGGYNIFPKKTFFESPIFLVSVSLRNTYPRFSENIFKFKGTNFFATHGGSIFLRSHCNTFAMKLKKKLF